MNNEPVEFRDQIAALNQEFTALLPGRLDEIEELWRSIAAGNCTGDTLKALTHRVHVLSGSAATFGYPELSQTGLALEKCLRRSFSQASDPADPALDKASSLIAALRRGARHRGAAERFANLGPSTTADRRLVYLVEDEQSLAQELSRQLFNFGYDVRIFSDTRGVAEALAEQRPDALVADIMLPEGDLAGVELLTELKTKLALGELPVLFVSARSDIDARLATARCGCGAYFVKPLDVMALVDRLNRLTLRDRSEPFRILIVDDDRALAERYALVLRQGGMYVSVLTRPKEILHRLDEETPDLVLMDVNMPECSGPDLVSVLRQFDRFVSLPIVYLSTETDLERQLAALRLGGDDFLAKPLTDSHLLAAVTIRAERSRVLKALMTRDSLTGLLTHVPFKERLASELARSDRLQEPLAFAMLDLDRFKQVNDRHGHLTGDQVLRSLAHLLRKRVRLSDTVGRYGGEEFGIILPDCGIRDARRLVEALGESFAEVRFRSAEGEFNVTFSAGVAAAQPGMCVDDLIDRADKALYRAKAAGGDQVVANSSEDDAAGAHRR